MEAEKSRTVCSIGRKKEKSHAQIGNVAKSTTLQPIGITKRSQRVMVWEDEIFAYTEFQNRKPISRLVIRVQKKILCRFGRVVLYSATFASRFFKVWGDNRYRDTLIIICIIYL